MAHRPDEYPRKVFQPLFDQDWLSEFRAWWWGGLKWYTVKWLSLIPVLLGWMKPTGPWKTRRSYREERGRPRWWASCYRRRRWKPSEATHYQLYENTSEGTPISPHFPTVEELAEWCAEQDSDPDNGVEVWVDTNGMGLEEWTRFFDRGGFAMSAMFTPERGLESGVAYATREEEE